LEKRHYTEKIIPKLIVENNSEISDINSILKEQVNFYKTLYTSSNPIFSETHEALFFDENNEFLRKLNDDQKLSCEGDLSVEECLLSLKKMKNSKSPGYDGYTVEFYKFFWNDIKEFLIRSFNYSYKNGEFSVSQRQGLVTCIPKEGKCKYYLKNWRPITLLNVDVKIASSTIANRIKPVLQDLISDSQKGFLKGRYIGECTRLISDLIDRMEEDEIPGLLVLLDFEKAFDTIEWEFIQRALKCFGFGDSLCTWIETFYSNISSCIINNGHCSELFNLQRGVRQNDALSPYIFILVLELLSAAVKNNPNISGVKVNNTEYLLSQYADDSSLTLDDDETSLDEVFKILLKFSECTGLRANLDKTHLIWIGSKKGCGEELLPDKKFIWIHNGKFKLLGIQFDLFAIDKTLQNLSNAVMKIKQVLKDWTYRNLSLLGKITVIKSLALPILVHPLSVLQHPSSESLKEIENIFFNFLWNGKRDRIKRDVLINDFSEGGLKMVHIESFSKSIKMPWLHKLLDPLNHSKWKTLLLDTLQKYGGDKTFLGGKDIVSCVAKKLNPFWRDVLINYASLLDSEPQTSEDILSQSIWFNSKIQVNNRYVFLQRWCNNGVFYIHDLLNSNDAIMSFTELKKYL